MASLVGPPPGGLDGRIAGGEVPFYGVAGHDGIVHQEAERQDEGRDRHLLQVDAEQVDHAEGHGQRDRDGEHHQHGGAPLPEADERHDDHERDGLVERVHEEVEVLLHLQRLVGGALDEEVGGKAPLHPGEGLVHLVAELVDLLADRASGCRGRWRDSAASARPHPAG